MIALDILLALVFAIVVDIACDWLTRLSKWLVGRAASTLPRKYRARYTQEWTVELSYRPRLLRIFFAVDLFRAARDIRREVTRRQSARKINSIYRPYPLRTGKRAFDLVFAGVALIVVAPLMAVIALGVKLSSPGPVLFRQRVYGPQGEEINLYKFRSMTVCENDSTVRQATRYDTRTTPSYRFLRRSSLDELPQLFNVIEGKMSLVGPRPHPVRQHDRYRKLVRGYKIRYKVLPGITGWAQINGFRDEFYTEEHLRARLKFDIDYLSQWSLWLDIKILVRTVSILLRDDKSY